MNRRSFLRLGALFVPVVATPTVAYSFCGGWRNELIYSTRTPVDDFIRLSIERSIANAGRIPWNNEPYFDLSRIVIKGTISI